MKKTGICACYTNRNYGSMLQSFAAYKAFCSMGLDCEFIRYKKKKTPLFVLKSVPRLLNRITLSDKYLVVQKKIALKKHPEAAFENRERDKAFERFVQKYFTALSKEYYGRSELVKAAASYAGVISGSDQVWSPSALATHFYDLTFVPDGVKTASYASSFGVKKIPFYQIARTKRFLNRIPFVSARELAGQKLIGELTGREVPVVCDPTFLFDEKAWEEFIPKARPIKEKYIFAYFLGPSKKHRQAVKNAADKLGLKIAAIRHMDQFVAADENFGDIVINGAGPEEFLNLIRCAEYVCTDSFHGTIFSIIHKKQFLTFNRYSDAAADSKNSRIDSLCELLGLQNRRCIEDDVLNKLQSPIDYAAVEEKSKRLKDFSWEYIQNVASEIGRNAG